MQPFAADKLSRRRFLRRLSWGTSALLTSSLLPGTRMLGQDRAAANDRFGIGQIGCGGQGNYITDRALAYGDLLAVCDVDRLRAEKSKVDRGNQATRIHEDYREVLDNPEINVVMIGTPDHWHTKVAIDALRAGKDVYCEKPLTLTINEGKQICRAAADSDRVFQVGTQQRSEGPFAQALALVRAGKLGAIQRVEVAIGTGPTGGPFPSTPPPANLNWDRWLGQAPLVPYILERSHYQFRWWLEYSGGKLTDWGAHHVDIAHRLLDAEQTGPISLAGSGEFPLAMTNGMPAEDDQYNTATRFDITAMFNHAGFEQQLNILNAHPEFGNGIKVIGEQGTLFVDREKIEGECVEALTEEPLSEDAIERVCKGQPHGDHMRNFFDAVKTRGEPLSDVFSHHRALTTCHLANLAIRLGRAIRWDPKSESIVGDDDANQWLARPQRAGYETD